jgi:hypothetical protein
MAVKKTRVSVPIIGGKLKFITFYYEEDRIWTRLFLHLNNNFTGIYLGVNDINTVRDALEKILNTNCDSKTYPYNGLNYSHLINLFETYTSLFYSIKDNIDNILIVFNSNDPTRKQYFEDRYIKTIKINQLRF